jgi:hypothetical protein
VQTVDGLVGVQEGFDKWGSSLLAPVSLYVRQSFAFNLLRCVERRLEHQLHAALLAVGSWLLMGSEKVGVFVRRGILTAFEDLI